MKILKWVLANVFSKKHTNNVGKRNPKFSTRVIFFPPERVLALQDCFCGPFLIKGSETGLPHTTLPPADPVREFWGLKQTCAEAHGYCWTQLPSWSVSVSVWDGEQGPDHLACSGPARTGTSKLDLGSLFCKDTGNGIMVRQLLDNCTEIISLIGNILFLLTLILLTFFTQFPTQSNFYPWTDNDITL